MQIFLDQQSDSSQDHKTAVAVFLHTFTANLTIPSFYSFFNQIILSNSFRQKRLNLLSANCIYAKEHRFIQCFR